jgi:hypothetical protein
MTILYEANREFQPGCLVPHADNWSHTHAKRRPAAVYQARPHNAPLSLISIGLKNILYLFDDKILELEYRAAI